MEIIFREIDKDDLNILYTWRCSPEVDKYMFQNKPDNFKKHVEWYKKVVNDNTRIDFIINADNVPIGYYGISNLNKHQGCCECGFYIGDLSYRNKGIFSFSHKNIVNFLFDDLKYNTINLKAYSHNHACEIYKKIGFKLVKTLNDICYFELHVSDRESYDFSYYNSFSFNLLMKNEIIKLYKRA